MYVTELGRRRLSCVRTSGDSIFNYVGPDLHKPRDTIVDGNDNCIICDQAFGFRVFKSDGSFYRLLCYVNNAIWMTWRKTDDTLIVCNGKQLITYAVKFD